MTRRHFLTTGIRFALLALLLPLLPREVETQSTRAEVQPDGSVLFDGNNDYLQTKPFSQDKPMTAWWRGQNCGITSDGRVVCYDLSGNNHHLYANVDDAQSLIRELRIYPGVHDKKTSELIINEMKQDSKKHPSTKTLPLPSPKLEPIYIVSEGKIYQQREDGSLVYQSENTFDGVDSYLKEPH